METRRMRIVPFIGEDRQWHATLVVEWLRDGKVYQDERFQMGFDQFIELREAVYSADNSQL